MTKPSTPNNDRSNVKNPNNQAHSANNGNRGSQLNPQHANYGGAQSGGSTAGKGK